METLTLNIDSSNTKGKALLLYLKAIASEMDSFLSIENMNTDNSKEENLLNQIEAGLKDVKKMRDGKASKRTLVISTENK